MGKTCETCENMQKETQFGPGGPTQPSTMNFGVSTPWEKLHQAASCTKMGVTWAPAKCVHFIPPSFQALSKQVNHLEGVVVCGCPFSFWTRWARFSCTKQEEACCQFLCSSGSWHTGCCGAVRRNGHWTARTLNWQQTHWTAYHIKLQHCFWMLQVSFLCSVDHTVKICTFEDHTEICLCSVDCTVKICTFEDHTAICLCSVDCTVKICTFEDHTVICLCSVDWRLTDSAFGSLYVCSRARAPTGKPLKNPNCPVLGRPVQPLNVFWIQRPDGVPCPPRRAAPQCVQCVWVHRKSLRSIQWTWQVHCGAPRPGGRGTPPGLSVSAPSNTRRVPKSPASHQTVRCQAAHCHARRLTANQIESASHESWHAGWADAAPPDWHFAANSENAVSLPLLKLKTRLTSAPAVTGREEATLPETSFFHSLFSTATLLFHCFCNWEQNSSFVLCVGVPCGVFCKWHARNKNLCFQWSENQERIVVYCSHSWPPTLSLLIKANVNCCWITRLSSNLKVSKGRQLGSHFQQM